MEEDSEVGGQSPHREGKGPSQRETHVVEDSLKAFHRAEHLYQSDIIRKLEYDTVVTPN